MLDVDDRAELESLRNQAQRPRVVELLTKVLQGPRNVQQEETIRGPIQRTVVNVLSFDIASFCICVMTITILP